MQIARWTRKERTYKRVAAPIESSRRRRPPKEKTNEAVAIGLCRQTGRQVENIACFCGASERVYWRAYLKLIVCVEAQGRWLTLQQRRGAAARALREVPPSPARPRLTSGPPPRASSPYRLKSEVKSSRLSHVPLHMQRQVVRTREGLLAEPTVERFVAGVLPIMAR